jgi:hypothetical protein
MAIRYEIDPLRRFVRLTHVSRTPPALWRDTIDAVLAEPGFQRGFDFVDDLSVRVDVPTVDIQNAVDFLNSRQSSIAPCRWAVVVHPQMPAVFGMLRMAELLMQGSPVSLRVFTSVGHTLAWLGSAEITRSTV